MEPDTPESRDINTGGGAYIEGAVQTGGDFVGRDKHVHIYHRSDKEELADFVREAVLAYKAHLTELSQAELPAEPYKFLLPFGLADQAIFFGRDAVSERLVEMIFKARLTVLHAPSGAGKSSLLNAGVAPRLLTRRCLPVLARTYNDPITAIINTIAQRGTPPRPRLLPVLPLRDFLHLVVACMGHRVSEVVIILDQLEEIFTQVAATERSGFAHSLAECLADEGLPLRCVLIIRGDYFSQLGEFSNHWPHIFHHQFYLRPMQTEEISAAITEPVKRIDKQIVYDEALLNTLFEVLQKDEMDLPELQILCTHLYALAKSQGVSQINLDLYHQAGGAQGILGSYLEQALAGFPNSERLLAEQALFGLVDSQGQRRLASLTDLSGQLGYAESRLHPVLNQLVTSRLVQRAEDGRYSLAHDYLAATLRDRFSRADLTVKQTRELLEREVTSWRINRSLIARDRLEFITQQQAILTHLDAEETELLCRSAVAHQVAVDIWALAAYQQGVDIWPILQPALSASDLQARASAVAILSLMGEAALPALGDALADPAPLVRVRAIQALEQLGSEAAWQTIMTKLQAEVYIPPDENQVGFYIDRYPVTQAAYQLFLQDHPDHEPPDSWSGRLAPTRRHDHPVVGVSWYDAQAYAAWAGKRLPTAAEWQRAAGGPAGQRYPWGDHFLAGRANTREVGLGKTMPVSAFSPAGDSPYGVADMAGNVWEWLADEGGPAGGYRQLRGGAWLYSAEFARIDYDHFWRKPDQRHEAIGFRLCVDGAPKNINEMR